MGSFNWTVCKAQTTQTMALGTCLSLLATLDSVPHDTAVLVGPLKDWCSRSGSCSEP